MNVIRYTDANFTRRLREVTAPSSLFDPEIERRVRAILADVHTRGDAALLEFTERFDGAKLHGEQLAVTQAELLAASIKADESLRAAVTEAETNIANFAKKIPAQGLVDEKFPRRGGGRRNLIRFQRVGIYIPGGTAPLVSTALMTITAGEGGRLQGNRRMHTVR